MASEERFGYEWKKYARLHPMYQHQFKTWTTSLEPEDFKGKDVLDAGCGMGRNSYWPLTYGAKSVTAFDNDEQSLASARKTLEEFKNVQVIRCDISQMPWQDAFDIAICIGVIHHLRNPQLALQNLCKALRPAGRLVVWVYSYEEHPWVKDVVSPIRTALTSRLPLPVIHALSYACSVPLYAFIKLFNGPTPYLRDLSKFEFWHVHSIVFDQLIPSVANYWTKDEVDALANGLPLTSYTIDKPRNGNGWTIQGIR